MHYVKQFNINGVDTKQVACIELQGKPNAATEGYVGVLGIDMLSPFHEVYKCVAKNGSIYTWELLSSGLSTIAATISGEGEEVVQFPYDTLKIPSGYVVKIGDLIIDRSGNEYQVCAIDATSCSATHCGTTFLKGEPGDTPFIGENGNWWIGNIDTGVIATADTRSAVGSYVGTGKYLGSGGDSTSKLTFDFVPKVLFISAMWVTGGKSNYPSMAILHDCGGVMFDRQIINGTYGYSVTGIEYCVFSNNTVSWRAKSAIAQMNASGVTYNYTAFGKGAN